MMTPRIMAFRPPRPRGARARRVALACRVETLEPRFLLAGAVALIHKVEPALSIDFQAVNGQAAGAATELIQEQAGPQSTLAAAQALPLDTRATVDGTLSADGPPAVFRVPLDVANFPTLAIGMSWTQAGVSVAGRVRILDNLGRTLVDQALSNRPAGVALALASQEAAVTSLFIEIVPASGRALSAGFLLSVRPEAAPSFAAENTADGADTFGNAPSWTVPSLSPQLADTATGISTVPVSVSTPSSPGPGSTSAPLTVSPPSISATGPTLGPVAGTSTTPPPRLTVPLPQSSAQPAAGIFVTADMLDAQIHELAAVVADLSFLDLAPAASSVTAIVAAPYRTAGPGSGTTPAPEFEPWTEPVVARRENGAPAPGYDVAEPRCLVFGLPPSGVMALDRSRMDPANARRALARPALPRLGDETVPAQRPDVSPAPPIVAATEPANRRRPRAVAALLYGSFCAMIGVVAPEWTQILRPPVRGRGRFTVG